MLTYHKLTGFRDNTQKASHNDQHSLCLVSAFFCLILSISIVLHTNIQQLQTVIFQSPAPQLQETSQNLQHYNKVWGSSYHVQWHQGNTCTQWHAPLDTTPTTHSIPDLDSETTAGCSEDTNPQVDLAQLQEHFMQLKKRLSQLGPTTNPPMHAEKLAHLTEKEQQLVMMLQSC